MSNSLLQITRIEMPASGRIPVKLGLYLVAVLILAIFQLVLGANEQVTFYCVATIFVSMIPALMFGWYDLPSFITLFIGLRYSTTALLWKTAAFEPIDLGLYAPATSFTVAFCGTLAVSAAALAAHMLWPRQPLVSLQMTPSGLRRLRSVGLGLAAVSLALRALKIELPGAITGILLDSFCIFPIAWLALNKLERPNQSVFSSSFVGTAGGFAFLCLAFNSRQSVLLVIIATICFAISFRVRPPALLVVVSVIGGYFFLAYLSPAMLEVRSRNQAAGLRFTPQQMLEETVKATGEYISGNATPVPRPDDPRYNLIYLGGKTGFIERFISIQQMDYIVALVEDRDPIGVERLFEELKGFFFLGSKEDLTNSDYAMQQYGVVEGGNQPHIDLTTFGSAYSYGGYPALVFGVFLIYLIHFMTFRLFCPSISNSVFGAFFLATEIHFVTGLSFTPLLFRLIRIKTFEYFICWWCLGSRRWRPYVANEPTLTQTE